MLLKAYWILDDETFRNTGSWSTGYDALLDLSSSLRTRSPQRHARVQRHNEALLDLIAKQSLQSIQAAEHHKVQALAATPRSGRFSTAPHKPPGDTRSPTSIETDFRHAKERDMATKPAITAAKGLARNACCLTVRFPPHDNFSLDTPCSSALFIPKTYRHVLLFFCDLMPFSFLAARSAILLNDTTVSSLHATWSNNNGTGVLARFLIID